MPDSLSRTFAQFVAPMSYESLPPSVVDKMKASILHAMVTGIIGADTSHGKAAIHLAKTEEGKSDGATILVDGGKATRSGAAFANSKLMHVTNQADSYRMLIHPGACVIPAALAAAELGRKSGKEFLTAAVAGYEVEARIAGDFIPSTQARGFRSSPVYGTLGAAIATGKMIGLTEDQLVTALALACTFTGGTTQGAAKGGQEMMYHEPNSTRSGIMASLLAQENLMGSEESLEGEAGFYNAFTGNNRGELSYVFQGSNRTDMANVVADLGTRWEVLHVTPKIYQTAGYNCPVIDLMTQIRSRHELSAPDVTQITVDMNWLETLYPSPEFPNTERNAASVGSTHYFTAYTFVHGFYPPLKARIIPDMEGDAEEQQVLDLLQKVEVIGHKDRPAFAPHIAIKMRDGTTYEGEYNGTELQWGLETEISRISELFSDMDWPREKLEALVQTVSTLEEQPSIDSMIQLCVR